MERHLNAPDGNLLDYLIQNHSHHLELIGERWVHDRENPPALLWGKCIDEDVSIDGSMCKTHVTTCIKESLGRKLRATVSLSFSVHNLGVVCTERLKLTTFCLKDMEENLCDMIAEWGLRDPHAVDRALGLLKPCIEQFKNINEQEGIIEL